MTVTVTTETQDNIGTITLNRPEAKNTFNRQLAEELNQALWDFDADPDIRVILLQAKGKHFCTGIELTSFDAGNSHLQNREFISLMDQHNHTLAELTTPVVNAVRGYTLANGAGLCFASDITLASETTIIGTTAINVGLICLGPAVPLRRLVGRKKALEMVLTGTMLNAQQALDAGLVNHVVPDNELEEEAMKLARDISQKSPLAVQAGKEGLNALEDMPYHKAADHMSELFASLCSTEDAHEGLQAFLNKRPPQWRGC